MKEGGRKGCVKNTSECSSDVLKKPIGPPPKPAPARQGGAVVQSKNDYERLIIRESTARERFKDMGLPYSSWDAFWIGYHEGNTRPATPSLPVSVIRGAIDEAWGDGYLAPKVHMLNSLAARLPESERHLLLGDKRG